MPTGVCRVLSLACGLLLALPPGWCCGLTGGACCGSPPFQNPEAGCRDEGCARPACGGGCCCAEPPAPISTLPADAPKPHPDRPCDTVCCERAPAAVPKVEQPLPDLGPAGVEVPLVLVPDRDTGTVRADAPPRSAFPPLHLLHCVWLC